MRHHSGSAGELLSDGRLSVPQLQTSVGSMTQKLTLEAADAEFDDVLQRVIDYTEEAEPDCEILV